MGARLGPGRRSSGGSPVRAAPPVGHGGRHPSPLAGGRAASRLRALVTIDPDGGVRLAKGRWRADIPAGDSGAHVGGPGGFARVPGSSVPVAACVRCTAEPTVGAVSANQDCRRRGGDRSPPCSRLVTAGAVWTVHLWWLKCASPVRDGETITVRGSRRDLLGHLVIRVTNFGRHWPQIHGQVARTASFALKAS